MFMIYKDIFHSHIWKEYFSGIDQDLYSIYIHAVNENEVNQRDLELLKDFSPHIIKSVPTSYGGVGLWMASTTLMSEALKDP